MEIPDVSAALDWHAGHCDRSDAPVTARVIRALKAVLAGPTQTGRTLREWPGQAMEDALALRIAGGLHYLHLTGAAPELAAVYRGDIVDQQAIDAVVSHVVAQHDGQ